MNNINWSIYPCRSVFGYEKNGNFYCMQFSSCTDIRKDKLYSLFTYMCALILNRISGAKMPDSEIKSDMLLALFLLWSEILGSEFSSVLMLKICRIFPPRRATTERLNDIWPYRFKTFWIFSIYKKSISPFPERIYIST